MSVVELQPMADVEQLVSHALRADESVAALVDDRVWTSWPSSRPTDTKQAAVLITRIGGGPAFPRPLALDACDLQVDCYGGRKHASWRLCAVVCEALAQLTDRDTEHGVVHGVSVEAIRYVPDESFAPARPRYVTDVTVTTSPPRSVATARSSTPVASSGRE